MPEADDRTTLGIPEERDRTSLGIARDGEGVFVPIPQISGRRIMIFDNAWRLMTFDSGRR